MWWKRKQKTFFFFFPSSPPLGGEYASHPVPCFGRDFEPVFVAFFFFFPLPPPRPPLQNFAALISYTPACFAFQK